MPINSVDQAFSKFMKELVNLAPSTSENARSSQAWLLGIIQNFEDYYNDFPESVEDYHIAYGSFARKTKIRDLDDIDLMIGLHAHGSSYFEFADKVEIVVNIENNRLHNYTNDDNRTLNSRKVINAFINALGNVSQYSQASINRRQEAAVLNLASYSWSFDIVPCFRTNEESDGRTYYLIPDGKGNWKKTDPRIDRDTLSAVNSYHGGKILDFIRLAKYWNQRQTAPSMPSYLLETILIYYFYNSNKDIITGYIDIEFPKMMNYISSAILGEIQDVKKIQGNINKLEWDQKIKIRDRAVLDSARAVEARSLEVNGEIRLALSKWGEVFGPDFPAYGD